jgi:hypothetical protein
MDSSACRAREVERKVWRDNDSLLRSCFSKRRSSLSAGSAVSIQRKGRAAAPCRWHWSN